MDNRDIPAIHIFHYIFHCAAEITNQYGGQLSHCAGGRTIWRPQCHHHVLVNVSLLLNRPHEATAHESFAVQLYMAWVLCIFSYSSTKTHVFVQTPPLTTRPLIKKGTQEQQIPIKTVHGMPSARGKPDKAMHVAAKRCMLLKWKALKEHALNS